MTATCGVGTMIYILPMLLGRTYDMRKDSVGIDIYSQDAIDQARKDPIPNPQVTSNYMTIERSSEKRDFIGISGELALKISSGLVSIKGAGEYLKDTSNVENSVEILIKLTFSTMIEEIDPDLQPLNFWKLLDRDTVGTHVLTSITYGGEVYASVNFIAHKSEYLQEIRAEILGTISKSGAFDINAQGKLEDLAKNISSKAKMEIDFYATVPLEGVPTTIDGLKQLVANFREQAGKVNDGNGVGICVGLRPLSDFDNKFSFIKNQELLNALDNFNYLFDNLREAKAILKDLVKSLPETVTEDYLKKVIDFSGRLTDTLMQFHEVIGNMDLEKGSQQLHPAETAFDTNSEISGDNRYTKEITYIASQKEEKEDPNKPRGTYIRWGKRSCGPKSSNILYIGFMSSFVEQGIGAGIDYQCLPENPNLKVDPDATGLNNNGFESKLTAVRYRSLSGFRNDGKDVENKVGSCTVCETPMRPSIKVFPGAFSCPGDWVQEYMGFFVSNNKTKNRAEFVCLDYDPDSYEFQSPPIRNEPVVVPIKLGSEGFDTKVYTTDSSLPCSVCSK